MWNVEFASITVKESTCTGGSRAVAWRSLAYVTRWYTSLVESKGCGFCVSRWSPMPWRLSVAAVCTCLSSWGAKEGALLSNCQASRWTEDAVFEVTPVSHAAIGLNKRYIKLKLAVPEGSGWQFEPKISTVVTEADLAFRSFQTKYDQNFWEGILVRTWHGPTLGLR